VTDEARRPVRGVSGISRRVTSWLAWLLGLFSGALLSASAVLLVLNRPTRVVEGADVWGTVNVPFIFLTTALAFTLVGTLIASRRPNNPIGWVSLAASFDLALFNAAGEYAIYALVSQPGSLPGASVAAWLREWTWVLFVGMIGTFLVLLFPDGRLLSRRWWVVAGLAVVALIYFGGVAATQAVFRALTGQEEQPQLAVVISTMVIAALFNPLRRRIQSFIDRRFYRSKYDARKTLEAFSAKLRDETDLDALREDLVGVVRETMQPAHVSLWLRPDLLPRGGEGQE
jgi:hypothetical protein